MSRRLLYLNSAYACAREWGGGGGGERVCVGVGDGGWMCAHVRASARRMMRHLPTFNLQSKRSFSLVHEKKHTLFSTAVNCIY